MSALQRAGASRDDHDVAVRVGEALGLDMSWSIEESLNETLAAPEGRFGFAHGSREEVFDLFPPAGDLEATTSTAMGCLDSYRQPVGVDGVQDLVDGGDCSRGPRHLRA